MSRTVYLKGYVTRLSALTGKSSFELERALGFNGGALRQGYAIYELAGLVAPGEFEWKDRTRYADGWRGDPRIELEPDSNVVWLVRREDELRAAYGKRHGYDERATDRALAEMMARELAKLNVRTGPDRIVKLAPNAAPTAFPESELRDVPQWRLMVLKPFRLLTSVAAA